MPKKFLRRYLPDHKKIVEHKHMRHFGTLLHDPNLWHLNRRSVPGAFSVGIIAAFIPLPLQMLIAAAGAIFFRVNLPISVGLVWLTNPFTMPPLFYLQYKIGAWLLREPTAPGVTYEATSKFADFSFDWFMHELSNIWQPFLLGTLILAVACAVAANLIMRGFWHWHILHYLKKRRERAARREKA